MKHMIFILLSVTLIQSVIAKLSFRACEIFNENNLKFANSNDGEFVWSKKFLNIKQNMDACLRINGKSETRTNIKVVDLNNGGVIGEKEFGTQYGQEECMQFVGDIDTKEFVIKLNMNEDIKKLEYIRICQDYGPRSFWPPTKEPTAGWSPPTWPSTPIPDGSHTDWTVPSWPTISPGWTSPTRPDWTQPTWPSTTTTTTPGGWPPVSPA